MKRIGHLFRSFLKTCPLTSFLIFSVVCVTIVAIVLMEIGYYPNNYSLEHPFLMSVLLQEHGKETSTKVISNEKKSKEKLQVSKKKTTENTSEQATTQEIRLEPATYAGPMDRPVEYAPIKAKKPKSAYYDSVDKKPLTTVYPYKTVTKDYYNDALFIGDSRIEGLSYYGDLGNATFCYKEGLSVYALFDEKLNCTIKKNKTIKLQKLLKSHSYKKIYIMIGVNELGRGTAQDYGDTYGKALDKIRALAPESIIIMMGIMNVSKEYNKSDEIFNNDNINARNVYASEHLSGDRMFYYDVNEAVVDKNGALKEEYTSDGIHLKAEYTQNCVDWLNAHGLDTSLYF